jgi:hypothetical protein
MAWNQGKIAGRPGAGVASRTRRCNMADRGL